MPNIVVNVPTPVSILLVTFVLAFGFACVARMSGELDYDELVGGIPWGGPASTLVNYTLYVGLFLFLTSIGWFWGFALALVAFFIYMQSERTKALHPHIDALVRRDFATKKAQHAGEEVPEPIVTLSDQEPPKVA